MKRMMSPFFLPTMTAMLATMGSTIASLMFVWAIVMQYCPYEVRRFAERHARGFSAFLEPYVQVSVHEISDDGMRRSEAYKAVEAYLSENTSRCARKLKVEIGKDSSSLILSLDESEKVTDEYEGVRVWWASGRMGLQAARRMTMGYYPEQEKRFFRLTCHKKHREIITGSYLSHVIREGKEIRSRNRQRKLYTNSPGYKFMSYKPTMWSHIAFEHPATFDTMAMEPDKKQEIMEDLVTFTKSRDFYARIGKAWKRGYLLYGPPGTGKSTMIAAMANFLHYDVYDLELTAVRDNTELRRLLIETTSKSMIVVEDIDCSLDLTGQRKKTTVEMSLEEEIESAHREGSRRDPHDEATSRVTLSGLLNVIDGLWSSCGGERLVVFTTNFVEKLDPALIRRGRMDKHIKLSYCSFEGFKVLARNYLDLDKHTMFNCVRRLMAEVKMTPADVAENLMPKSPTDNGDKCLSRLIQALEEAKATTIGEIPDEEPRCDVAMNETQPLE